MQQYPAGITIVSIAIPELVTLVSELIKLLTYYHPVSSIFSPKEQRDSADTCLVGIVWIYILLIMQPYSYYVLCRRFVLQFSRPELLQAVAEVA